MDIAQKIIAREQRAAEDRLVRDRAERLANLAEINGPRVHTRRQVVESISYERTPEQAIRTVTNRELDVDPDIVPERKLTIRQRIKQWWSGIPADHTHKFVADKDGNDPVLKIYPWRPNDLEELYDTDAKGEPLEDPPFVRETIPAGTTGKLVTVLFASILVVQLGADRYAIALWEHVRKL